MVYIYRNGKSFGPYHEYDIYAFVCNGQVLMHDHALIVETGEHTTVRDVMTRWGLRPSVRGAGNVVNQISHIGSQLIFPISTIFNGSWISDKRLLMLALVGLTPSVLMYLPLRGYPLFYVVALYFSLVWGLFFYYFFKTRQVKLSTTLTVFFAVQLFVFVIWDILGLPNLNIFYHILDQGSLITDWLGYTLGVGLTEEFVKALPLFILAARAREPLLPQTLVYYGLMSGIGFGVFEGVQYQLTFNAEMDYDMSFFMNIARLTSLPFIHAIWCGIAGYFIAFAKLYPRYRAALYILAIAIPAVLHGAYDTFAGSLVGMSVALTIMMLSVLLLITYLRQSVNYQTRLR